VHEPESCRVRLLVAAAGGDLADRVALLGDEAFVRRADLAEVPGPADHAHRARPAHRVAGAEPLVADPGLAQQPVDVLAGAGRHPGALVQRAVSEVGEIGGEPLPIAPGRGGIEHDQVEATVPADLAGAVDPGGRLIQPAGRFGREQVARSSRKS
jgi:hypothetical protein